MDMVIDIMVEAVGELFVTGFVSLYKAFVPHKCLSPKVYTVMSYVFLVLAVLLLIGSVIGVILPVETQGNSVWGWILVASAGVYLIGGILLKIIDMFKRH